MELKVWVEGIQRIVCGVTDATTCQDVVFALAHATGKVGKFTLTERWRNNERLLSPQEYPLKILMKWGEYSNDIQFILRQSDSGSNFKPLQPTSPKHPVSNEPPPPYRSPPPAHAQISKSPSRSLVRTQMPPATLSNEDGIERNQELVTYNIQYRELVSLVNYQREKISSQQVDLIKYDAEIGYWETKGREQERQGEILQQHVSSLDDQLRINTEQVQALIYIEEENESAKKKENALRSEILLVRSKLASLESELQQIRSKARHLMDEILSEQRLLSSRNHDNRQNIEQSMMSKIENLQIQIQNAKHATEINHMTAEKLKYEVGVLETAIMEKKRQVERLVQEMKEANLQSLTGSVDELCHPLDGMYKTGSARRIIGSPRQLENAAPTNKNPHGVWV